MPAATAPLGRPTTLTSPLPLGTRNRAATSPVFLITRTALAVSPILSSPRSRSAGVISNVRRIAGTLEGGATTDPRPVPPIWEPNAEAVDTPTLKPVPVPVRPCKVAPPKPASIASECLRALTRTGLSRPDPWMSESRGRSFERSRSPLSRRSIASARVALRPEPTATLWRSSALSRVRSASLICPVATLSRLLPPSTAPAPSRYGEVEGGAASPPSVPPKSKGSGACRWPFDWPAGDGSGVYSPLTSPRMRLDGMPSLLKLRMSPFFLGGGRGGSDFSHVLPMPVFQKSPWGAAFASLSYGAYGSAVPFAPLAVPSASAEHACTIRKKSSNETLSGVAAPDADSGASPSG
mmetsp:Transcript_37131/g.85821  ORF Transcript_37131/g.85821 Transcript_37131/m.85821 type:complete len:351 (+) Transcript_37131:222-1274(+)